MGAGRLKQVAKAADELRPQVCSESSVERLSQMLVTEVGRFKSVGRQVRIKNTSGFKLSTTFE
jgi:hypothetical protein